MAVGHGGQVLLSDATATVARDGLPAGVDLVDLGEHRLRDLGAPMQVFQLAHPDLAADFPPLRSLDALPGNLPRQVTTFVGRDDDIANLAGFLRDRSLVTLDRRRRRRQDRASRSRSRPSWCPSSPTARGCASSRR